jgi:hypothetical protein
VGKCSWERHLFHLERMSGVLGVLEGLVNRVMRDLWLVGLFLAASSAALSRDIWRFVFKWLFLTRAEAYDSGNDRY